MRHRSLNLRLASSPGEPGIHCMRMRVIAAEFRGDRILFEYARIFMTSCYACCRNMERFLSLLQRRDRRATFAIKSSATFS